MRASRKSNHRSKFKKFNCVEKEASEVLVAKFHTDDKTVNNDKEIDIIILKTKIITNIKLFDYMNMNLKVKV